MFSISFIVLVLTLMVPRAAGLLKAYSSVGYRIFGLRTMWFMNLNREQVRLDFVEATHRSKSVKWKSNFRIQLVASTTVKTGTTHLLMLMFKIRESFTCDMES